MKNSLNRRLLTFCLFFTVSFSVCLAVTAVYINNRIQLEQSQMEQLAMNKANKVHNVLTKLLYRTQTLAALVVRSNGEIADFQQAASVIIDDPAIKNVILAPDGIVKYVYPSEGNEQVLGLNYFLDQEGNKEATLAKQTQQMVLGGPFHLVQGGQALVGRLPVYMGEDKSFWGIVSVTLKYPEALAGAELDQLKSQGFAFEIWRINPDDGQKQIIASSDYKYSKDSNYIECPMEISNAKWYFKLSPIRSWHQFYETWVSIIVGFFISLLIGFLMIHNYDLKQMRRDLEEISLHDPLTRVLNRRGVFQSIDRLISISKKPFILCFIDLNKFKFINDTFGHHTGDRLLKDFAEEFQKRLHVQKHIFARVGGDEFVLVAKDTKHIEELEPLLEDIKLFFETWSAEKGNMISISFSLGYAIYPEDGSTIDDLIILADRKMYENKRNYGD